jgi:hypothetical protein
VTNFAQTFTSGVNVRKEFSKIERRLFDLLRDGDPHKLAEMIPLVDERASSKNLMNHFVNMRKKLRPKGIDILCVIHNRTCHYRLVRVYIDDE